MDDQDVVKRGQEIIDDVKRDLRARALTGDSVALDLLLEVARHDGYSAATAKAIEIVGVRFGAAGTTAPGAVVVG